MAMEGKTVLIVDDAIDNRVVYGLFLEHFGVRVLQAQNGWEGVQQARQEKPDLILMDLAMPVMDGIEATRHLRADESTASIPVIVVSGHADPRTRAEARECGCDLFLSKPVRPSELALEVRRFLGCKAGLPEFPPSAETAAP